MVYGGRAWQNRGGEGRDDRRRCFEKKMEFEAGRGGRTEDVPTPLLLFMCMHAQARTAHADIYFNIILIEILREKNKGGGNKMKKKKRKKDAYIYS